MLDGSGQTAMDVFDIGAHPDNMRSIPWKEKNKINFQNYNVSQKERMHHMIL